MLTSQQRIVALVSFVFFHDSVAGTSRTAPVGAEVLTVAVIGGIKTLKIVPCSMLISFSDYGWTGWVPSPDKFSYDVLPTLEAAGITVPNEVINGRP
jgi:tartrate-resistant acid phosphatase type 5